MFMSNNLITKRWACTASYLLHVVAVFFFSHQDVLIHWNKRNNKQTEWIINILAFFLRSVCVWQPSWIRLTTEVRDFMWQNVARQSTVNKSFELTHCIRELRVGTPDQHAPLVLLVVAGWTVWWWKQSKPCQEHTFNSSVSYIIFSFSSFSPNLDHLIQRTQNLSSPHWLPLQPVFLPVCHQQKLGVGADADVCAYPRCLEGNVILSLQNLLENNWYIGKAHIFSWYVRFGDISCRW